MLSRIRTVRLVGFDIQVNIVRRKYRLKSWRPDVLFLAVPSNASQRIGVWALRERFASWIAECRYPAPRLRMPLSPRESKVVDGKVSRERGGYRRSRQ